MCVTLRTERRMDLNEGLQLNWRMVPHGYVYILLLVLVGGKMHLTGGQTTEVPEYTFKVVANPADWDTAAAYCASQESQLARLTDNYTQAALETFLSQNGSGVGTEGVWVGARQEDVSIILGNPTPIWRWSDIGETRIDIRTAILRYTAKSQGCFSDSLQNRDLPFEITYITESMRHDLCLSACRNEGYSYAGLQVGAGGFDQLCFCGNSFGQHGSSDQCTTTCDGDASEICGGFGFNWVLRVDGTFVPWRSAEPANQDDDWCGTMDQWNANMVTGIACAPSSPVAHYLCYLDSPACRHQVGGGIYYNVSAPYLGDFCMYHSAAPASWYGARQDCQVKGGDILSVFTPEDIAEIKAVLPNPGPGLQPRYTYIGLVRRSYYWPQETDLSIGLSMEYNNFETAAAQPDASLPCVHVNPITGMWATASCDNARQFVCLKEPKSPTTSPDFTTGSSTANPVETTTRSPVSTTTSRDITPPEDPERSTATETTQIGTTETNITGAGALYAAYALIGILVVLLIVLVILAIIRSKKNKMNKVSPNSYDARTDASRPESGYIGDTLHDMYDYETNSQFSTGSQRNLLTGSLYSVREVPDKKTGQPMEKTTYDEIHKIHDIGSSQ